MDEPASLRCSSASSAPGGALGMLLLHGAGGDATTLAPVAASLAVRGSVAGAGGRHGAPMTATCLALPGRGGDARPPCRTVAEMAAAVAHDVAARGLGRLVVAGHSLGGAIALELALLRPSWLAGVALISTGARLRVHPEILAAVAADDGEALARWGLPWPARAPVATHVADWRAANDFDRMARLAEVGVPALVVVGTNDTLTPPKYADALARGIPGATLVVIEGAGHIVHEERPAALAGTLADFAETSGPSGA